MAVRTTSVDWAPLLELPADANDVGPTDATDAPGAPDEMDAPGAPDETVDPQPDTARASAMKMAPQDR
jgi:hypothetical protein